MTDEAPYTSWTWCAFRVVGPHGRSFVYGSSWQHWAVHRIARGRFVVTHMPSGFRVTEFERLAIARRFCERINDLTDWYTPTPAIDSQLSLRVHRAALDVSGVGAKPALRLIDLREAGR